MDADPYAYPPLLGASSFTGVVFTIVLLGALFSGGAYWISGAAGNILGSHVTEGTVHLEPGQ